MRWPRGQLTAGRAARAPADPDSRDTPRVLERVFQVRGAARPPACPLCHSRRVDSAAVKAFFQRVSVDWDQMRSSFYNADIIDALAARTALGPHTRMVDVGTGTGTGFVAAGLAGRVAGVIGVDNSPAMLAVAAGNLTELGIDNVALVEGELDALPLPDDSLDAAVANMVLHHAPDPPAMLTEMARVVPAWGHGRGHRRGRAPV